MRRGIFLLCFVWLAACGTTATSNNPNTITMVGATFNKTSITFAKGSTMAFLDDSNNGATHYLVLGQNGQASGEKGAPDFGGASGHRTNTGDVWTTGAWSVPGTYHVTCTVHPAMNLTITVTP